MAGAETGLAGWVIAVSTVISYYAIGILCVLPVDVVVSARSLKGISAMASILARVFFASTFLSTMFLRI